MNMKCKIVVAILILVALSACSAKRFYNIQNSEPQKPELQKYHYIHLGWLPINEDDWQKYEYGSKKEWIEVIRNLNVYGLQKSAITYLTKRNITGALSADDKAIPPQAELFIRFNSIKIENRATTGIIEVDFIDVKNNAIVYKATAEIDTKAYPYGFENNCKELMYYIFNFLYYQLT